MRSRDRRGREKVTTVADLPRQPSMMRGRGGLSAWLTTGPQGIYALTVCILILLAVGVVFGQTLRHEFVNYDDDVYVYDNPHIARGLTAEGIAWVFTHSHGENWHPLTGISHMLDCQIYGLWSGGHHLTNVLLHAVAAILLFLVLFRMTGKIWPSAFVAAVFAIHPLRVESVAWVAERKDVLSGLFFMLTLEAYIGYARQPFSLPRYLMVTTLFALGLTAKSMLVTLPFVLLLLDCWPLGRFTPPTAEDAGGTAGKRWGRFSLPRGVLLEKLPWMALAAATCAATLLAQVAAIQSIEKVRMPWRIANALVSYVAYLGQFFCPVGLAVLYPHPGNSLPAWKVVGALLVLVVISAGVLAWRRRVPGLLVGWLWYLGMLVPVIGLVQVGAQAMADRYTYLPLIGLCIAVVWGVSSGVERLFGAGPSRRRLCGAGGALVVVGLMACARRQTSYWKNSEALWAHTLACTSRNNIAHNNLGPILSDRGQVDEAIAHYKKALEINPDYADAHNNLGIALARRGQVDEAITQFQKALKIKPDFAKAHHNFGVVLSDRGQVDEAIAHYKKALEISPDYADAHNNLGIALARRGQVHEAITQFRMALKIRPNNAKAHNNLGLTLARCGQVHEAITQFQKALEIKPDYADARRNLEVVRAKRQ